MVMVLVTNVTPTLTVMAYPMSMTTARIFITPTKQTPTVMVWVMRASKETRTEKVKDNSYESISK